MKNIKSFKLFEDNYYSRQCEESVNMEDAFYMDVLDYILEIGKRYEKDDFKICVVLSDPGDNHQGSNSALIVYRDYKFEDDNDEMDSFRFDEDKSIYEYTIEFMNDSATIRDFKTEKLILREVVNKFSNIYSFDISEGDVKTFTISEKH